MASGGQGASAWPRMCLTQLGWCAVRAAYAAVLCILRAPQDDLLPQHVINELLEEKPKEAAVQRQGGVLLTLPGVRER